MNILIKFPSRGRPLKCIETLRKYVNFAKNMDLIQIVVSLDKDDTTADFDFMNNVRAIHKNITVKLGTSKSKIDAVNRDIPHKSLWDILLLASDDMIPVVKGYDEIIRDSMQQFFPDKDGVLFFNDGYVGSRLNTLCILGNKYYERFGYIYYPGYKSLWCDNEFMLTGYKLKKQIYIDFVIIKHEHPSNNSNIKLDELYDKNEKYWDEDYATFISRNPRSIDVSVLICTIPERQEMLRALLRDINQFVERTKLRIEILTDSRLDVTIGKKRNDLVCIANGTYSCFIDDDDKITPDYFKVIEDAINTGKDYDTIRLNGRYYCDFIYRKPFYHSIKYTKWSEDNDGYYRNTNHLNPIKTEIVRKVGFKLINHGEDHQFATDLQDKGIIKTEYEHTKIQYLYYFRKPKKIAPAPVPVPDPVPVQATTNVSEEVASKDTFKLKNLVGFNNHIQLIKPKTFRKISLLGNSYF
jgi:hypothetical protein